MENCVYKELSNPNTETNVKSSWNPFLRQLQLCSGIWMTYFMLGLSMGAPTVYIPQIRKEQNSTEAITENMGHWLSSVLGYAGIPWVFILPIFTHFFGRKIPFIILCIVSSTSFIVLYCSTSPYHLLISTILQGLPITSHHCVTPIILTEYTSPKYRGIFLTIKSASVYWGIWTSNAIGTFFHWRNIGLCGMICSLYTLIVFAWPESPFWLASKGRYDDCVRSHRWLKGVDQHSETELINLIKSQMKLRSHKINSKESVWSRICIMIKTMRNREFYLPVTLCMVMMSLYHLSGKFVCSIYAIEIIKKMTDSEATAYRGMLILDGVTVISMYCGCILSKLLRRRVLLLISSTFGAVFLFFISTYLYLVRFNIVSENKIISLLLLSLFSVTISCGPVIMSTSIYGELIPRKFAIPSMVITGLFSDALMATVLKVSPYLFRNFGLNGAFLFFGTCVCICVIILYKYLPETKDKTLQEIEDSMKKKSKTQEENIELM